MSTSRSSDHGGSLRASLMAVAGALAAYAPWMGWGMLNGGEYAPWQVIGSGSTFAAIAFVLGRAGQAVPAVLLMPVAYTAAWTWQASREDITGLYMVGSVLVLGGTALGAAFMAGIGRERAARAPR